MTNEKLLVTRCCFQWQTVCKLNKINYNATEKQQPER